MQEGVLEIMSTTLKLLWAVLGIGLLIGFAALSMWGVPAPTVEVKKTYTYDQLPRQQP
jgi:hypothetical protein